MDGKNKILDGYSYADLTIIKILRALREDKLNLRMRESPSGIYGTDLGNLVMAGLTPEYSLSEAVFMPSNKTSGKLPSRRNSAKRLKQDFSVTL